MLIRRLPASSLIALACESIFSACAAYTRYQASRPETVREIERMLTEAGFRTIHVDKSDSDQAGLAANLPQYDLRRYAASSGSVYWYYDPDNCSCVFEGNKDAFDRYQMLQLQQRDLASYATESRDQEVASLNSLNGSMFPPPIFWIGGIGAGVGGNLGGGLGGHGGRGGHRGGGHGGRHGR